MGGVHVRREFWRKETNELFQQLQAACKPPYVDFLHRLGMDFEPGHASGAVVEDRDGREYVDCIGGYWNLNVGHNHPTCLKQ